MPEAAKKSKSNLDLAAIERPRLVDHFKRAYQIVVGLSITLACAKLFPQGLPSLPFDISFWLFCIFFVTIVPIFQGGDRSLDIKYLHEAPKYKWMYLWDVYMLLITAILFVKIAQSIPVPKGETSGVFGGGFAPNIPEYFYFWMATMLSVDVAILVIDRWKNGFLAAKQRTRLGASYWWIILNTAFGAVCWLGYFFPAGIAKSFECTAIVIFLAALLRTALDYYNGRSFMFP